MSEAAATVAKPIQKLGVSDLSTSLGLGGGITGGLVGNLVGGLPGAAVGGIAGFTKAREAGQQIQDARAEAERAESARQAFNEEIFQLAESFQGNVAQAPGFNFDQLQFAGGDPRQQRLEQLVNIFTNRQQEVRQRLFQPGVSQTRLSLVE